METRPNEVAIPLSPQPRVNKQNSSRRKIILKLRPEEQNIILAVLKQQALGYESLLKNAALREGQPERYENLFNEYLSLRRLFVSLLRQNGHDITMPSADSIRNAFLMPQETAPKDEAVQTPVAVGDIINDAAADVQEAVDERPVSDDSTNS